MRFKVSRVRAVIPGVCLILISGWLSAQTYSFRNYGSEYGIPSGFVYTLEQSKDGFLWAGTGNGIARFDGYSFYNVIYPDSVETRNPGASHRDTTGSIWFGCNDGSVFRTDGRNLRKLPLKNQRSISQILPGPDGRIFIIPQGRTIFSIDPLDDSGIKQYLVSEEHALLSAAFDDEGSLIAGSQGYVLHYHFEGDSLVQDAMIEGFEYSAVTSISWSGKKGVFLIGTQDSGLFLLVFTNGTAEVRRFNGYPEWTTLNVRSIFVDNEARAWISTTGAGVIQFQLSSSNEPVLVRKYNTQSGLLSDDVQSVFRDMEGNYWFALFGEGISMLSSYAYGFYTPGTTAQTNNITFVTRAGERYLLGTPTGFHMFDYSSGKSVSFTNLEGRTGALIQSYFRDENGDLWLGTRGNGLYIMSPSGSVRLFYRSGDSGKDRIEDIDVTKTSVWLATTNGLVVLDRRSGKQTGLFDNGNGLSHNSISGIYADSSGKVYVGTEADRLYYIDKKLEVSTTGCMMLGNTINRIVGFSMTRNGTIWAATGRNGIFGCMRDSVMSVTSMHGLYSNYCYSIITDHDDNVWVGHAKGFSRLEDGGAIIRSFGPEYTRAGVCNTGGMYESPDSLMFIGTTEGVVIYDPAKDLPSGIAPKNNIVSVLINDHEVPYTSEINLPYGKYKVQINYSAINFSDPSKVYYQPYMENFDLEEGALTTDRQATYMLSDGTYRFNLISVDDAGLSDGTGSAMTINIAKPVYKKWWFILLCLLVISGIVGFIIWQREKAQRKIRQYLESELEIRTRLILKQNSELEIKNHEITDSISYAKRIQSSILPDVHKLKENFREAFVIFHPRDIVSGDFYWFDKVDDDKFIVVCADSTGHGVPGAFMSMIGSTLLQDIVTRKKITRPSQILGLLDKQIFSTLNQNIDLGVSNDGMDMVVCEFNLKTRHVRFASAMRPIILILSGEPYYIKGNRSSVGGESVIDKYFDDQEYYLSEGDTLYMFSDGFPDQFGGVDGKKMKIARLKKALENVAGMPLREQEVEIMKFFDEWRGSFDQVDDILLIGLRV